MSDPVRVLLWVQHLVGVGHQQRSAALARALVDAGARVCYVSGGLPVQGLDLSGCEFHQLPPARSQDMRYHTLVDTHGEPVNDAWRARRRDLLLEEVARFAPAVVITETWPFGRGLMRFELEPLMSLLAGLRPRPLLLGSVRDIVERRQDPEKYRVMARRVRAHFHAVLVHADPGLVPFEDSFPLAGEIAAWLHYTGYVSARAPVAHRLARPDGEVVVSAGGGFFGERLLTTALGAAALEPAGAPRRWRILAGPNLPQARFQGLLRDAPGHVRVERNRTDFHRLLDEAAVSVSQAGYNTTVDLLASRVPAVLVPYRDERESEQAIRAEHLVRRGLVQRLAHEALTPRALFAAVAAALDGGGMEDVRMDLDGARNGARLVMGMVAGHVPVNTPCGFTG